jgi:integrase
VTAKRTDDRTMRDGVKRRCRPECPPLRCPNPEHRWAYVVSVKDPATGKRRVRWDSGHPDRTAALRARRKALSAKDDGAYVDRSRTRLRTLIADRLAGLDAKPSTITTYRRMADLHIIPTLGEREVQRLTPADLRALYRQLGEHLSPASVRMVHAIISGTLGQAVRDGLLTANPCGRVKPPRRSSSDGEVGLVWTEDELRTYLDHVRGDRLYALWRTLAATGCRRGEALELHWSDLSATGELSIRGTVSRHHDEDGWHWITGTTKTGGSRKLALDPETVAVLREHKRAQVAERLAYGPGWTDLGLMFVRADGTRIRPPQVGKAFHAHRTRAGLPRIRLHDVRHSVASHLLARGVPVAGVAGRLGHSVTTCEKTYRHYIPSADAAAAAVMAEVMSR